MREEDKTRSLAQGEAPAVGAVVEAWSRRLAKGLRGRVVAVAEFETPKRVGCAVAILFDSDRVLVVTDSRKLYVGGSRSIAFLPDCKPDLMDSQHATLPLGSSYPMLGDVPDAAAIMEELDGLG